MITLRHTTGGRTPLDEWSASRRDLYLTTHNTYKETHIHAPGGIRTRNPSKLAAADRRLRPRGDWERRKCHILNLKYPLVYIGIRHCLQRNNLSFPAYYRGKWGNSYYKLIIITGSCERQLHTESWWENQKECDGLGYLDWGGKITLVETRTWHITLMDTRTWHITLMDTITWHITLMDTRTWHITPYMFRTIYWPQSVQSN